ncbi:hypothetical protein M529_14395 [Sphingobium ummariense RL-3]|uniref:Tail tape measure protein n=1 Tax=Sphingobium ummariense RL-3 TaxID=1346791 RepID=T0K4G5_9SPHN|nr:hypothetical protein M529_14395 [Sphingobium ummariense RL-3]
MNRTGRPLDKFRSDVAAAGRSSQSTGAAIGAMGRHMERSERSARGLGRAGETMGQRVAAGARRAGAALLALERRMEISDATMGKLAFKAGGLLGGALRSGVLTAGTIGGAAAVGGLYKIMSAGIQSENFETQLFGLEGRNAAAAKKDLDWITKFAANTPYDLAQVTQAFINARNAGINPMNGSLATLGDAAAALNKTYDDAIGMLADAKTEQYERMREFGITPSQKDGKVTLRYVDRLGKDMVKIVNKAGNEVERATLQILAEKFGGGGDLLSKTTLGKWNNLTDRMSQQAVKVWKNGFGDEVKRQLDRAGAAFENAEANGSADSWAKSTSQALTSVVKVIGDQPWEQYGRDFRTVANGIRDIANAAVYLKQKAGAIDITPLLPPQLRALRNGLDALHGYQQARDRATRQAKPKPSNGVPFFDTMDRRPARNSSNGVPFFDSMEARPHTRATRAPSRKGAAVAPQPQKAQVALHVSADRGVSVKTQKVVATGMDVDVNTGRAMGAFA